MKDQETVVCQSERRQIDSSPGHQLVRPSRHQSAELSVDIGMARNLARSVSQQCRFDYSLEFFPVRVIATAYFLTDKFNHLSVIALSPRCFECLNCFDSLRDNLGFNRI